MGLMFRNPNNLRKGFSLIELLVIIAVLAFLAGMLVPAVHKVRGAAARTQCTNNLRQLGLAAHNCNDTYKYMPKIAGAYPNGTKNYGTLFYHLLPFIEEDTLYKSSAIKGTYCVWHHSTFSHPIKTFLCPSDSSAPPDNKYKDWLATCNYAGNAQVFSPKAFPSIPRTFPDGTSNTILYAERYQMCKETPCAWGYPGISYWSPMFAHYSLGKFQLRPGQKECNPALAQTPHAAGIPVCLGDGSVRYVSNAVSPETWSDACTPADGKPLGNDWIE
jgi:hypothetical protein